MTAGHVQHVPDEVPLTREDVRDAIKTPEDGWRVVAALIRMEHGPDCPDHEVWELLAEVLERAASGDGSARADALAIVRAWGQPAKVPA